MPESTEIPVADPKAELIPAQELGRAPLWARILTLAAILIPLSGVILAAFLLWGRGFHWVDLGLLLGMYLLTSLGITVGFHRLFVHRSFDTYMWVKFLYAVLGCMALQGSLFQWVATHRRHHQHSDQPDDPHTPHHQGSGLWGVIRGFWHAHIGWFFKADPPGMDHYIKDLRSSPTLRAANALCPLWIVLGLVIPAVLGGLISQSWSGVWSGLIWGGLMRIFLVHHITWSINSACHLWGSRPYHSRDESRNNVVFGILAMGEGWHNTHHAFPTSARHGLRWWQIDGSYWVIRIMSWLGLAWNVKLPSREAQRREQRT